MRRNRPPGPRSGSRYARPLASGLASLLLVACPDDAKAPLGSVCRDDAECASGLCVEQICLDPYADDDGDTLLNGSEVALGTSPTRVDTDDDGVPDPEEVGPELARPLDRDGDGRIDALESRLADGDGDCIPDEEDPDDTTVDPAGCAAGADCEELRLAGEASGDFTIDPDGEGDRRPFRVRCEMEAERGGWTSLVEAYLPHAAGVPHEYLVMKGGAWIRTPPLVDGWSWDTFAHAPGTWMWRLPAADGALACPSAAPAVESGAVGLGCVAADGPAIWLVLAQTSDAAVGVARRCLDGIDDQVRACDDGWRVYARRMRCPRTGATIVGDGDFASIAAGDAACWASELSGASLAAIDDPPIGEAAPALGATSTSEGSWSAALTQRVDLAPGFTYRVAAWSRASGGGITGVKVSDGEAVLFDEGLHADASWSLVERVFVAPRWSLDARVEVFLGGDSAGRADVDALVVEPLGPDGCATEVDFVTSDPGFDHGLGCWDLSLDASVAVEARRDDTAAPPPGEASPVVRFDRPALADESFAFIAQEGFALSDDRAWRLEAWMKSDVAEAGRIQLGGDALGTVDLSAPLTAGTWTRLERELVTDPGSGTSLAWLHLKVGPTSGGTLLVDGVGVRDLGPHPCVPALGSAIGDPGFAAGTACWQPAVIVPGTATFARDEAQAPEGGTPPSLVFSGASVGSVELWDVSLAQRRIALTADAAYELTFFARAEAATGCYVTLHGQDFTEHMAQAVTLGTSWQAHRIPFIASRDETDAVLEIQLGQTRTRVWLDDVDIRRAP